MRAKNVYETIDDLLKPKSEKELKEIAWKEDGMLPYLQRFTKNGDEVRFTGIFAINPDEISDEIITKKVYRKGEPILQGSKFFNENNEAYWFPFSYNKKGEMFNDNIDGFISEDKVKEFSNEDLNFLKTISRLK